MQINVIARKDGKKNSHFIYLVFSSFVNVDEKALRTLHSNSIDFLNSE